MVLQTINGGTVIIGGVPQITANVLATTVTDTSGNDVFETNAGFGFPTNNLQFSKPADTATTTSTSLVMAGIGVSGGSSTKFGLTPQSTGGTVLVIIKFDANLATSAVVFHALIAWGTGTAPNNGDAATGTTITADNSWTTINTSQGLPAVLIGNITGYTAGTAIWIDLQYRTSNAADAAKVTNIQGYAMEL